MFNKKIKSKYLLILVLLLTIFVYSAGRIIAVGQEDAAQEHSCSGECEHVEEQGHDEDQGSHECEGCPDDAEHHDEEDHDEHNEEECDHCTEEDHDDEDHAYVDDHETEEHGEHDDSDHDHEAEGIKTSDDDAHAHEEHDDGGIEVKRASLGRLYSDIRLTGSIGMNLDNLAHIVPQTEGIVRQVFTKIGEL